MPHHGAVTSIRVAIADNNPAVRDVLRTLLAPLPGLVLVASSATPHETLEAATTTRPDVLLLDLHLPDGPAPVPELLRAAPAAAVLLLARSESDEAIVPALRAGARGYLVKGASPDELFSAITTVAAGGAVIGPGAARQMLNSVPALTPREREILALVASGLPDATIAARLGLAADTVGHHLSTTLTKLQTTPE